MEIIILLAVIFGGSFPILQKILADGQIAERTVKVAKASLNRNKKIIPGIVTSEMVALEPRNKDWGPDGKLTQMWDDAYQYWQLADPKGTLESYRIKVHEWEQRRDELKNLIELKGVLYEAYIKGRGFANLDQAVESKTAADKARDDLRSHGSGPVLTADERVVAGLAKRYGTEVFYNNDLVRLSAQKQMPTFDYIALTSV